MEQLVIDGLLVVVVGYTGKSKSGAPFQKVSQKVTDQYELD